MGFDRPEPAYVPLGCEQTFDGENGLVGTWKPVKMISEQSQCGEKLDLTELQN